jgi:hypothetical protein
MPSKAGHLVQGTLEMLVLKTLALQPMPGPPYLARFSRDVGLRELSPGPSIPIAIAQVETRPKICHPVA